MKSMLKAPGTERLKLTYDNPLSSFAFNFNLRRYSLDPARVAEPGSDAAGYDAAVRRAEVGTDG